MRDRRADLRLDVVADDRQAVLLELLAEVAALGEEDRDAVHHRAPRLEDLLRVPLGGLLGADGEVVDDDVRVRLAEDLDDVVRVARRLLDHVGDVLAEAVVGHAAGDGDTGLRDVGEAVRVVRVGPDGVGEVLADLVLRDVEGGRELHVAHVVAAEVDVHEPGHEGLRVGVLVVLDPLEQGVGAVPHADDRDADLVLGARLAVRAAVLLSHWFLSSQFFGERVDDELVDRASRARGLVPQRVLDLRRDAQEHGSARARRRGAAPSARLEGDGEALGEEPDRDVVHRLVPAGDLAGERALERRRHADEDALSASSHSAASRVSGRADLRPN